MKMGRFEKRFVNSDVHSHRVAEQAQQLVGTANPKPGSSYSTSAAATAPRQSASRTHSGWS